MREHALSSACSDPSPPVRASAYRLAEALSDSGLGDRAEAVASALAGAVGAKRGRHLGAAADRRCVSCGGVLDDCRIMVHAAASRAAVLYPYPIKRRLKIINVRVRVQRNARNPFT